MRGSLLWKFSGVGTALVRLWGMPMITTTTTTGTNGTVAYVALSPQPKLIRTFPVHVSITITLCISPLSFWTMTDICQTLCFPGTGFGPFEHLVSVLIVDSMSYNSYTIGCLFPSTVGLVCGVHVLFPSVAHWPGGGQQRDNAFPTDTLRGKF